MIFASKLTSKNRTTLPKAVLETLEAKPGATLCFEIELDGTVTLTAKTATFASLAGTFPKKKRKKPATLEEMQGAIRAGAAARLKRAS